jgi:hypothetical protein
MFAWQIKYNKIPAIVILDCYDSIPNLRAGKIDEVALASYFHDVKMWKEFRKKYGEAEDKDGQVKLIERWKEYIQLRNDEDFVPHSKSKNKYLDFFDIC